MKQRTKETGSESDDRSEFVTLHDGARHLINR